MSGKNLDVEKHLSRPESSDNRFNFKDIKDENTLLDRSDLKGDNKDSDNHKQIDDKIIEDIQMQLNFNNTSITPEHLESIQKLKELVDDWIPFTKKI